ncbi:MAG: response regulator [Verrucomicrobiota bacterium]
MHPELPILLIEKDNEYVTVLEIALKKNNINNQLVHVSDGEDAISYLCGRNQYADRQKFPFPIWIFTELRLPRVGGFEFLQWLKKHPDCAVIPVIVLSVSDLNADIVQAYSLGANSYIIKPKTLPELIEVIRRTFDYWKSCALPKVEHKCS